MPEKEDVLDRLLAVESHLGTIDDSLVSDSVQEILKLRAECQRLANYLMHEYVFVHERLVEELDEVIKPYWGITNG